jgi:succinyl-CoA synthetase beta subunit
MSDITKVREAFQQITKERDEADAERLLRESADACQVLIDAATGKDIESVARRAVAKIERLRVDLVEAREYQSAAAEALAHELEMSEEYRAEIERLRVEINRLQRERKG